MDFKKKYKAEDLLSGRIPEDQLHHLSSGEMEIAEEMKLIFRNLEGERLTELEKRELWERISKGAMVRRKRPVRKSIWLKIAASLLIVMAIGYWQYGRNTPTQRLLNFAEQNVNKMTVSEAADQSAVVPASPGASPVKAQDKDNIITTNDFNTLLVGEGKRSVIELADGTKVWLNSNSRLIYPVAFEKGVREVYLEGEAYFDVSHDKKRPFFVRAKNMSIRVLGTEFFVSSNSGSANNYAVLINGSISFSAGNWLAKTERQLVPGQQVNFNAGDTQVEISTVKTQGYQAWKAGYLDVESESLDVIAQKIAKYYNIEISTNGLDLSNERFSGRLDFQRNVEDVFSILCIGTPYVYDSSERRLGLIKN